MSDYLNNLDKNSLVNRVRDLERRIRALERKQVRFKRLDEVTNDLGLQQAGEFRAGNGVEPGDGFTGGRFGYPGFEYDGQKWFLAGVNNDDLMVGLDLDSGELVAGGGIVRLNDDGISIEEGSQGGIPGVYPENALSFKDNSGNDKSQIRGYLDGGTGFRILSVDVKSAYTDRGTINFGIHDASGNSLINMILSGYSEPGLSITGAIWIGTKAKLGSSGAICGGEQEIADNGVYSFTPKSRGGILLLWSGDSSFPVRATERAIAIFYAPTSGTADMANVASGSSTTVTTGALTGTTGADGMLTISSHNDGKIYIENRRGASRTVRWQILAGTP